MKNKWKTYIQSLEALDEKESEIKGERVVLFLSGNSTLAHAELSNIQQAGLLPLQDRGYMVVGSNFPYNRGFRTKHPIFPGLLKASWHNILYYIFSLKQDKFKKQLLRHFKPITEAKQMVIIAQSSGLNLFTQIVDECSFKHPVLVIALGPVSHKRLNHPKVRVVVIKGRKDWVSRLLDHHPVDYWAECDHFEYLKNKQVREYIYDIIKNQEN